jgi:hypothetical protein
VEEFVLLLKELSFPSIAVLSVLSVDVHNEAVQVDARCTAAGAVCPGCGARSGCVQGSLSVADRADWVLRFVPWAADVYAGPAGVGTQNEVTARRGCDLVPSAGGMAYQ